MILKAENLTVKYQNCIALDNINFEIANGEYVAIVGPNGAGKTTLVKALLGLTPLAGGSVFVNSDRVGYLQQKVSIGDSLFPASVSEIIKTGLLINKKFPKGYLKSDNKKVSDIIEKVGITNLANKSIGTLSGGELQKVLLARALICNPEILFLDEPTTALDPVSRENFYHKVKHLNTDEKITVLIISHDIRSVEKYATKLLYIDREVLFYGTFEEFNNNTTINTFEEFSSHIVSCGEHP